MGVIGGLSDVLRTWQDIKIMLQTGYSEIYYLCETLVRGFCE